MVEWPKKLKALHLSFSHMSYFSKHVAVNTNKSKLANATGSVLLHKNIFINKHVYVFTKGHKRIKKKSRTWSCNLWHFVNVRYLMFPFSRRQTNYIENFEVVLAS